MNDSDILDEIENIQTSLALLGAQMSRKFSLQDDHYRRLNVRLDRMDERLSRVIALIDPGTQMRKNP